MHIEYMLCVDKMTGWKKNHKASHTATPDDEAAFLASYDAAAYPHPSVTVDVVLFSVSEGALHTLVLRRAEHPFKGSWALPGGFVGIDESLEAAALRVLRQKCAVTDVYLEQLSTFGRPDRDPRTRVISVAYYALVDIERFRAHQRTDALRVGRVVVAWEGETGGLAQLVDEHDRTIPLAFDHGEILGAAVKRIRGKLNYAPIGFQLLPERFTLLELQQVHETVLGRSLNKDSFRRRMLASGELRATGQMQSGVEHRPAELYRFVSTSAV